MLKKKHLIEVDSILKINKLICILLIVIISFFLMFPANATTQSIRLQSAHGYLIKTTFSYDNNQDITMIREQGFGKTQVLDSLKVSFYSPSGKLISSYNNIIDGVVQGKYFEFNFDLSNQKLLGSIDLGGENTGEIYLKGEAEQELSLVEVKQSGIETIMDYVPQ